MILSRSVYIMAMIILPLGAMLTLLHIMSYGLPNSLPLAVVDQDQSYASRALIRNLDAFEQTKVVMESRSFLSAREAMQRGEVYGVIVIPKNFLKKAVRGERPTLHCYTNNGYLMAGSLLYRDLRLITELATGKVILEKGLAMGRDFSEIMSDIQPIVVKDHIIGNPWLNYSVYLNSNMLPGILQLLIMQITSYAIGIEIKRRSHKDWLSCAGGSIYIAVFGKFITHSFFFLITGMTALSLMYGFANFPLNSGFFPMALAMLFFIWAAQALGIFFFSIVPSLRLSMSISSLFGVLSFPMAGFSYPCSAMYPPLQILANLFPLRHYYLIYVNQALNGRPFVYSFRYYCALLFFSLLPLIVLRLLKKNFESIPYLD